MVNQFIWIYRSFGFIVMMIVVNKMNLREFLEWDKIMKKI